MTFELDFDYQDQLQKAEKKLAQLEDERDRVEHEIAGIKHVIEGLKFLGEKFDVPAPTLGPNEPPPDLEEMNFADKIANILVNNREAMTPVEIRNALQEHGVKGTTPKHLLISVHTEIARMLEKKRIKAVITGRGKAYRLPNSLDKFHHKFEEAEKQIASKPGQKKAPSDLDARLATVLDRKNKI